MIRVKARGLDGFQHELEVAEDRLIEGMFDMERSLAKETAQIARRKAGRERLTGAATDSISAAGPVVSGGNGIEHYGFADFGGRVGRNRSISRRYIKGGRYLFPGVKEVGVREAADDVVDNATKGLQ